MGNRLIWNSSFSSFLVLACLAQPGICFAFDCSGNFLLHHIDDKEFKSYVLDVKENRSQAKTFLEKAEHYYALTDPPSGEVDPSRLDRFYKLSLKYFLCAANAGSAYAAGYAGHLELSASAKKLSNEQIESVLNFSIKNNSGQISDLESFYCTSGDYGRPAHICDHPQKAILGLEEAAKLGSVDAEDFLANGYASGRYGQVNMGKAVACYQLAIGHGSRTAIKKLEALKANSINKALASCY